MNNFLVGFFGANPVVISAVEMESLHDFQLTPQRRPRILVQTAGHVAGIIYHSWPG